MDFKASPNSLEQIASLVIDIRPRKYQIISSILLFSQYLQFCMMCFLFYISIIIALILQTAARLLTNTSKCEQISPVLFSFTLASCRIFFLMFICKALTNLAPTYLGELKKNL